MLANNHRYLATIRTVSAIEPIPGADNIELARIDGWQCVAKKGAFAVGDDAVYFEIDSFLPASDPRFAFLGKPSKHPITGIEGYRIRTIKLRGALSQGLLLPVIDFAQEIAATQYLDDMIGVIKWERPESAMPSQAKGLFPAFLRKTDQERVQNMTHILADNGLWEASLKLDGSSMTVFQHQGVRGVCSRNLELTEDEGSFWTAARKSGVLQLLEAMGSNIAFQGELVGPGIQGNPENLSEHQFFVYDVFDIDAQRYLTPIERAMMIEAMPSLQHVPVLDQPICMRQFDTIEQLLELAEGPSLSEEVKREGLVFKRLDGRASFKVIANSYLLKEAA